MWHTLAIYTALVVGLRLVGRRQIGQLTVIDLVVVIVLGSAVETAMVAANTRLYAGLVSAGTLFVFNRILTLLMLRSRRFRHLVAGGPTLLIHNGHFVEDHLRREGLTENDVMEAIRERGEDSLENIKFAVMEADSTINVVPMDADVLRTKAHFRDRAGVPPHAGAQDSGVSTSPKSETV